jgi:hypothetical protein
LKLKSLVVITLLALGCGAAFGQGSFVLGFTSAGDFGLYCNYEEVEYGPGSANNFYMQGIDNTQDACYAPYNATIEGVKVSISASDGAPVLSGPAYGYADNIYDAFSGGYTGFQWYVITQTKPSTRLKHYGWAGYAGFSGLEFLGNYGYLSASIPGNNKSGKPVLGSTNAAVAKASVKAGSAIKTITK